MVSRVELGFPGDSLREPFIRTLIHGENDARIERPESPGA